MYTVVSSVYCGEQWYLMDDDKVTLSHTLCHDAVSMLFKSVYSM